MRKVLILLFILFFSVIASADEIVYLDNSQIQNFKGQLGKWVSIQSRANLNQFMKKFDTSIAKVQEINGNEVTGKYVFIPYSKSYLKNLNDSGITREKISTSENEFIWPLGRVESISSTFGMRCGQLHTGADMPAQRGTPILAAMDGRIVFTGYSGGHGKTIYIEHRNDFYSRYSHNSVIFVNKGDYVKRGQIIGYVGSSGRSTGNHLHFEIRYKDVPLNPLDFLPFKKHLKQAHRQRNWR